MHDKLLAASLLGCLLGAALAAQTAPPPIPPELRARFGFLGPYALKIGDGIEDLQVADIDGDGRREAVVSDPRRARLAGVRWNGNGVELVPLPLEGQIAGYTHADVDGKGGPELVVVDTRGRLSVRAKGKAIKEPIDLGLGGRGVVLRGGDLDGDGKADIVASSKGGLRWVTGLADAPVLSPIEPLEEKAYGMLLDDLDGDRRPDLAFVVPGPTMNLRLRPQAAGGGFGPWQIGNVENLSHAFRVTGREGPLLATIEGPQRRVALHRFARTGGRAMLQWWAFGEGQPQGAKALPFCRGDFDGDGDEDLAIAQGERARLQFLLWQDGTYAERLVPSLAGISALAVGDVDQDGKQDLLIASAEEDAVAWRPGSSPLDAFPSRLPTTDKPVAVAAHPEGGMLVLVRNDKRDARLERLQPGKPAEKLRDLGRLPADPARLLVADIGDEPGPELAFVVPGEGLRIVSLQSAGVLQNAPDAKPGKGPEVPGFTKKIDDGALSVVMHDGAAALQVVRDRFVRRFRVDATGQVQVIAQDNGPEGIAELGLAAVLADRSRVYLDRKAGKLVRVAGGSAVTSVDVPTFDFSYLLAHGDACLLLGTRGVLRVPFGDGPVLVPVGLHEPPTERTTYWHGIAGDFDGDGAEDLCVLDGHLPGAQILTITADGLQRALAMPVFETPPREEAQNEPRALAVGDLDGDGRTDLVLLAHDRVLVYLQEK